MSESESEFEVRGYSADAALSVTQLSWSIKTVLQQAFPSVWVEGELSDISRPSSGHIYATLKDDESQIRIVMWRSAAERLKFKLEDGQQIVARGTVEVYSPRGTYQLILNRIEPKGVGGLQLALQQLHRKLEAEGLFLPERKRQLPKFPRRIGFVTSPSGAAFHDFVEAAVSLWQDFELILIPARVQGEGSVQDVVQGIRAAQKMRPALDVLVVGRGGGSAEDLWTFNEEPVVRALAACTIPTVSAVGHDIDVTLCDLVADCRALTPTQAPAQIFPNQSEIKARFGHAKRACDQAMWGRVRQLRQRLKLFQERSSIVAPHCIHQVRRQRVDELELLNRKLAYRIVERGRQKVASLARAAEALSPLAVLQRGYSLTQSTEDGLTVRSVDQVQVGERVTIQLHDGKLVSTVEEKVGK